MTTRMTATELKATILRVLDEVSNGSEVEITKHGRTVARLVPAKGVRSAPGAFAGVAVTSDDQDDLLSTGATWDVQ